jgi:hypothetical protein
VKPNKNDWKDQHYYIPNGKVDAKFSQEPLCHMIVSSCSSSSDPIRCNHIIWKERILKIIIQNSDFWPLCLSFNLNALLNQWRSRGEHMSSPHAKEVGKLKHNDLFQVIFSISQVNLKTSSSAFFFFWCVCVCVCVWSFIKFMRKSKTTYSVAMFSFFPENNRQILQKWNKTLKFLHHVWIVILVSVAFLWLVFF